MMQRAFRVPVLSLFTALLAAIALLLVLRGEACAAWSSAIYVTTGGANASDAAVNPITGDLSISWYDGTSDYWYTALFSFLPILSPAVEPL